MNWITVRSYSIATIYLVSRSITHPFTGSPEGNPPSELIRTVSSTEGVIALLMQLIMSCVHIGHRKHYVFP